VNTYPETVMPMVQIDNWSAECQDCKWRRRGYPIGTNRAARMHSESRYHTVILLEEKKLITTYAPRGTLAEASTDQPPF
jgi:hypothetical protein